MSQSWLKWSTTSTLLMLFTFSVSAQLNLNPFKGVTNTANTISFVPADQAFHFNFSQHENKVSLKWNILPEYYLYQDKIKVIPNKNTQIGNINYPESILHTDEFFGETGIYKKELILNIDLLKATPHSNLTVYYQGCAAAGFCYPPEKVDVPLSAFSTSLKANKDQSENLQENQIEIQTKPSPNTNTTNTNNTNKVSSLADNWWQPLLFLALGIGLAFTPCVLPMYPILTGIVLGGGKLSHGQTFRLSLLYVQGMALTYTLLGLVVASAGLQFQAALQNPYVLGGLSTVFLLLAASMFGAINLQLPASIQTYLSQLSNQQQGGNNAGVFTMGAISGLICSPCTTAPLSGALLYVAQSGDLLTGAITLYALALGMGIPLILAAMFGNKLLPKAGGWMDSIKTFFGFVLIAAAIFFMERILSPAVSNGIWILWLFLLSCWLFHISRLLQVKKFSTALAAIAILGISSSAIFSYHHYFAPIKVNQKTALHFTQITSVDELNQALAQAKADKKAVMLDFYADWCAACKEFEKYTFHDPSVATKLDSFVLLQVNVTETNAANIALLKDLNVLGLPTIDFWNEKGDLLQDARLTGFVKAQPFMAHLKLNELIKENTLSQ